MDDVSGLMDDMSGWMNRTSDYTVIVSFILNLWNFSPQFLCQHGMWQNTSVKKKENDGFDTVNENR